VNISDPDTTVCLQAVDYFLWVLQRFYEARSESKSHEDRYLKMLWPQFATVHDLQFGEQSSGTTFSPARPLTVEARFPPESAKGKKRCHEYRGARPSRHEAEFLSQHRPRVTPSAGEPQGRTRGHE
jgi:hypothetical protein